MVVTKLNHGEGLCDRGTSRNMSTESSLQDRVSFARVGRTVRRFSEK